MGFGISNVPLKGWGDLICPGLMHLLGRGGRGGKQDELLNRLREAPAFMGGMMS